jgi:small GTP-binding protein
MFSIILSFFHQISGPKILIENPKVFSEKQTSNVARLIDSAFEKGFFIHKFPDMLSANYFFEVPSSWARGRRETVLISILFNSDYKENLSIYETSLTEFVLKFLKEKDIYQSFYISEYTKLKFKDSIQAALQEAQSLIQDLIISLPIEIVSIQKSTAKLFVFGLDHAGKTTLLNRIKDSIFIQTSPTLNVNILQILLNNLQIVCFDVAGQKRFRDSWRKFMNATNGLIFVIDSSDFQRIDEAREELLRVLEYEEAKGLPLLILSNKIDLSSHVTPQDIIQGLHLNELRDRDYTLIETSALNNIGVQEGFSWIAKQILNKWAKIL